MFTLSQWDTEFAPYQIPAVLLYSISPSGIIFWIENGASCFSSLSRNSETISWNTLVCTSWLYENFI